MNHFSKIFHCVTSVEVKKQVSDFCVRISIGATYSCVFLKWPGSYKQILGDM